MDNFSVQLKWVEEPKGELDVPVGKPVRVPCEATGQPSAKIEWTKLVASDISSKQAASLGPELRFGAITQDDSGLYECRASNGLEEDLVARIKLNVLGK